MSVYRETRKIHQIEKGTAVFKVGGWAIRDKYMVCDIVEKPDDEYVLGFATITIFIEKPNNKDEYKKIAWRRYPSNQVDVIYDFGE